MNISKSKRKQCCACFKTFHKAKLNVVNYLGMGDEYQTESWYTCPHCDSIKFVTV